MYVYRVFILMLLLCLVMVSCSNLEQTAQSNEPEEVLSSIYLHMYSDASIKPQPELIDVEYEDSLLSATVREIEEAGTAPAALPAIDEISRIYVLELVYEKEGMTTSKDQYIMVWDNDGRYYIKKFEMTSEYHYDKYDDQAKAEILQHMGADNWIIIQPLTMLTS
ncbi:hypothetical protein PAECIP111893_01473 [Paenibacillus plantiphilus]|uniref:Uncharacterized protein n=1 Tax=Paenibacillus plantiphilus TaxID=2905650 RepID=A0ABN8GAD8_9BACL|nr:hypothetical protein [Paenibacillus plantiphilus]CAH1200585.1 hypothetical protein PAECIP111893_01473 [Paenibacillus plantiphilus]